MTLDWVFEQLQKSYGPQHWWPAESRFEVLVGAVLVQNTAWLNAEKAVSQLRAQAALTPNAIVGLSRDQLAASLRPAGYFNIKSERLCNLCHWFLENGGFVELDSKTTTSLREKLLSVSGLGRKLQTQFCFMRLIVRYLLAMLMRFAFWVV